jgi:hypothetical protein
VLRVHQVPHTALLELVLEPALLVQQVLHDVHTQLPANGSRWGQLMYLCKALACPSS